MTVTRLLLIAEAISSIAASHRPGCTCDVCAAAAGDVEALERAMTIYMPRLKRPS